MNKAAAILFSLFLQSLSSVWFNERTEILRLGSQEGRKKVKPYLKPQFRCAAGAVVSLFSLFKRGEIRLSWNRRGREGVWEAEGEEDVRIGIGVCTFTKSSPTTTQPCVSSFQPFSDFLSPKAHHRPPTLNSVNFFLLSSQISLNLRPPQTPHCFL